MLDDGPLMLVQDGGGTAHPAPAHQTVFLTTHSSEFHQNTGIDRARLTSTARRGRDQPHDTPDMTGGYGTSKAARVSLTTLTQAAPFGVIMHRFGIMPRDLPKPPT
ncbi:hypothetical protein Psi02_18390 [Planotetraspora silvatica]|uniref:Uncharacterized protein n=1 Tax=Planotetraspora silvatica TaxID=234614 RepID=A0A8J3UJ21_9ACTN|nr:hypothetical protein Psi02_18390 [Planotetraspora silvatica]